MTTETKRNIFITTTLPYANGPMHIGAALEFVLADAITRKFRNIGHNVHLNIGLDQNGSKILSKSRELGIPLEQYLTDIKERWIDSCSKLEIGYDNFYETSSDEHRDQVQKIWKIFVDNGDIVLKDYSGKYCLGCESFKLDKDLVDGKCPDHPTTNIETISEKNYFFGLDRYQDEIRKWISEKSPFIPSHKENEVENFIEEYKEISVSRNRSADIVGIEVPDSADQIVYIWAEALLNYYIACSKWKDWNDCEIIQTFGPDNNRFQSHIFQAFLASLKKKNTDRLLVHGTVLDRDGRKISKTLGNVVDPIEQSEKFGTNAVRYYCLAGLNTYADSGWNESDLTNLFNSDICNDWGNLISRTLHLIETKNIGFQSPETEFKKSVDDRIKESEGLWESFRIRESLQKANSLVKFGNQYINTNSPWSKEKTETEISAVLNNLHYLLKETNRIYLPVFPSINPLIDVALESRKKIIPFDKIK